jgi:hypothetical protein
MMEYTDPLAGSAGPPPPVAPKEVREVQPVVLDKNNSHSQGFVDKDFSFNQPEEVEAPKALLAPESVSTQTSPTGLEDVSKEDLDNQNVQPSVEKVTSPPK